MKLLRKILIYTLSLVLVVTPVFISYSQAVYAASNSEIIKKALQVLSILLGNTGTVVDSENIQKFYNTYKERIDTILTGGVTVTEKGEYTFSSASVEEIRALFDEYISSTPEAVDVVWMPVITEKNIKASWYYSSTMYYQVMSILDNYDLVGFYQPVSSSTTRDYHCAYDGSEYYVTGYVDLSDVTMHVNVSAFSDSFINGAAYLTSVFGNDSTTALWSYVYYVDSTGINVTPSWHLIGAPDGMNSPFRVAQRCSFNPFFSGKLPTTNGWNDYIYLVASSKSNIHYVPVFRNANVYKDWITGQGGYYKFDSGYTGGDITINPDADYSEITDAIQNAMQQAMQSGKNMADALSDMQKAFTSALGKLNGTLGDIEDNTSVANEWLEKIYNKLVEVYGEDAADRFLSIDENLDEFLQRYLQIYGTDNDDMDAPFNQLVHNVKSMGELLLLLYDRNHDDAEHLELFIKVLMEAMITQQQETNGWLEKIFNRVDDIYDKVKAILFVDTVDAAVDIFTKVWDSISDWIESKLQILDIMTEATQVGNIMKTKFPFSIPWDVYAILMMFDAPAKPPVISLHFEMPFLGDDYEFNYEYIMDEQMWINLSAVCRFFLIISYDITLIHLTQKLYAAGLFDVPSVGRKKR